MRSWHFCVTFDVTTMMAGKNQAALAVCTQTKVIFPFNWEQLQFVNKCYVFLIFSNKSMYLGHNFDKFFRFPLQFAQLPCKWHSPEYECFSDPQFSHVVLFGQLAEMWLNRWQSKQRTLLSPFSSSQKACFPFNLNGYTILQAFDKYWLLAKYTLRIGIGFPPFRWNTLLTCWTLHSLLSRNFCNWLCLILISIFFKYPTEHNTFSFGWCGFSCSSNTFSGQLFSSFSASSSVLQCNSIPPLGRLYANSILFSSWTWSNFCFIFLEDFQSWASLILSTTIIFPVSFPLTTFLLSLPSDTFLLNRFLNFQFLSLPFLYTLNTSWVNTW